jgi:hypothetical protein
MHYGLSDSSMDLDPLSKFLKEMGLTTIETEESIKLSSVSSLPEETRVMVLERNL